MAGVWGIAESDLPGPGVDAYEMFRKIDAGEIKGLLSICFNPKVSLPDNQFITRCLDKLEFFVAIDFFLNETARHADVVLPGSLHEEDEGIVTQVEGRVIKINKAVDCPGEARQDWRIIQDIATALGRPHGFTFAEPREIFEELRVASKGGVADYSGITYEKIEQQMGVFWPCYSEDPRTGQPIDHPGTPRLFEPGSYNPVAKGAGPFYFPDGKARFNVADYRVPVDDADDDYPVYLTTGRVISQFLSGTQTRRIGPLVAHTRSLASRCIREWPRGSELRDGEWATIETRRGELTLRAQVVTTIRPDSRLRALPLERAEEREPGDRRRPGSDQQDPSIQGVRLPGSQGGGGAGLRRHAGAAAVGAWMAKPGHLDFYIDPNRCIGCQACVQACTECDTHRGRIDDSPRVRRSGAEHPDRAGGLHALRAADLRRGLPGRCHQAHRRRRRPVGVEAALHCVRQLRDRVSVWRSRSLRTPADHDEVRHVLRPIERRQEADVRDGLPEPGVVLRDARRDRATAPALGAHQHVPIRRADDYDACVHDGAQARRGG